MWHRIQLACNIQFGIMNSAMDWSVCVLVWVAAVSLFHLPLVRVRPSNGGLCAALFSSVLSPSQGSGEMRGTVPTVAARLGPYPGHSSIHPTARSLELVVSRLHIDPRQAASHGSACYGQ